MTADQAAQSLVRMMEDTDVPFGVRAKIAQDLLDRAGLASTQAIKIAQSDDDRMARIRKIADEMRHLQEQKNEALRMKLRGEVDAKTFREVTAEIDAAHDQLAREHKRLASEAAMPQLPDPTLAWEDLSAEDRRALTEMLVDKIVVAPHPYKIVDGRRHYTIRAIPYQEPQQEAERLQAVHEARVKIVPRF
jgi:hypothetical protein